VIHWSTDLLSELGYESLTQQQADELLDEMMKTLEALVGARFVAEMESEQLKVFEEFFDTGDEPGALSWLKRNYPDYATAVKESLDELRRELRHVAQMASNPAIESVPIPPPGTELPG
jgi:Protein of unknown function (DUF5663)